MSSQTNVIVAWRRDCSDLHSWGPGTRTKYIIHYVIKGSGFFITDGKKYHIKCGQSFLIRPFTIIQYYPDIRDPWEYTWIEYSSAKLAQLSEKIKFCQGDSIIDKIDEKIILPFYNELIRICNYGELYNVKNGLAQTILGVYIDFQPLNNQMPSEVQYYHLALDMIECSFHKNNFGIADICKSIGISRVTLHRAFKRCSNISPGAFLTYYRIERAKEMLKQGTTVKLTALSCGFANQMYFSKVFSEAVGVPPKKFSLKNTYKL